MRSPMRSWSAVPRAMSAPMITITRNSAPSSSATGRGSRNVSSLPTPISAATTKSMAAESNIDIMVRYGRAARLAVRWEGGPAPGLMVIPGIVVRTRATESGEPQPIGYVAPLRSDRDRRAGSVLARLGHVLRADPGVELGLVDMAELERGLAQAGALAMCGLRDL